VWIANEPPDVIPGLSEEWRAKEPVDDRLLLCVNGHPKAWTDGHGTWIEWLGEPDIFGAWA